MSKRTRSWTPADYERQWRSAVHGLIEGADRTRLLTCYHGPEAPYLFSWPMWWEGSTVFVQEQIVGLEQLAEPFDPNRAWESVGFRKTIGDDGQSISEWQVPLVDLIAWARKPARGPVSA